MSVAEVKRAGLPVDLDRLAAEGDGWLTPDDRYALKTIGVCSQGQPGVFMLRVRSRAGVLQTGQARALACVAAERGRGWLHLTTRQQVEIHHVGAEHVRDVLAGLDAHGLTTRSSCGHTVRGVLCCPEAGAGLAEPFDCSVDARLVSDAIVRLGPEVDPTMPQRLNVSFGGCDVCRDHAKVNDVSFVSLVRGDGELGYALWIGGSLGKSVPSLAVEAVEFLPRADVLPALLSVLDLFRAHNDLERPQKARLKFVVAALGAGRAAAEVADGIARHRARFAPPPPVSTPLTAPLSEVFGRTPSGGWGRGVRPQRIPGFAMCTVRVPLGDMSPVEMRGLAGLADAVGDERVVLTPNQNVLLRHVPVDAVGLVRDEVGKLGLDLEDPDQSRDVRVCTAAPVCSLAITAAQAHAVKLVSRPTLRRNSPMRVHVSGCPNACAQHQVADLGLSGGKVTVGGVQVAGYQVWLGGDLRNDRIGRVAGRVAASDVEAVTDAVVGVWEAMRDGSERLSDTVARLGHEAFEAQIAAVLQDRWAPGPEPAA